MANTIGPFGFRYIGLKDGSPPNFGIARGFCAAATGPLFTGDPLVISGGKLVQASVTGNSGAAICGVAVGFAWTSIALGRVQWAPTYPGNDSVANADVAVYFANNPNAIFEAQVCSSSAGTAVGGPAAQADAGKGINFSTGAGGNTSSGVSSFGLDYSTANATLGTLPFIIYYLDQAPKTDPTTAGNIVRVALNAPTVIG